MMASKGLPSFQKSLKTLRLSITPSKDPLTQCLIPRLSRSMATETELPSYTSTKLESIEVPPPPASQNFLSDVLTTIYKFPSMEPIHFKSYPANHLHLPLRRDILHRAVVFEADGSRQGTANTKNRWEVHGSHRKIRPQKGTGSARLGTRQSPMLRGGGKSFGPKFRDFSTELPRKMYDLAWRTALSWRYRKGDLIICQDGMDIQRPETRYAEQIFGSNHWGKEDGRSLIITTSERENLFKAMQENGSHGRVKVVGDVDVKNLLESGRVIIEKGALAMILKEHQTDLR